MHTYIFEVVLDDDEADKSVIMVGVLDKEWAIDSVITFRDNTPLIQRFAKWSAKDVIVFDLGTGEGARFKPEPGGDPRRDLQLRGLLRTSRAFLPFLEWLYQWKDLGSLGNAPVRLDLEAPPHLSVNQILNQAAG